MLSIIGFFIYLIVSIGSFCSEYFLSNPATCENSFYIDKYLIMMFVVYTAYWISLFFISFETDYYRNSYFSTRYIHDCVSSCPYLWYIFLVCAIFAELVFTINGGIYLFSDNINCYSMEYLKIILATAVWSFSVINILTYICLYCCKQKSGRVSINNYSIDYGSIAYGEYD